MIFDARIFDERIFDALPAQLVPIPGYASAMTAAVPPPAGSLASIIAAAAELVGVPAPPSGHLDPP